jgi:hypothetical protein
MIWLASFLVLQIQLSVRSLSSHPGSIDGRTAAPQQQVPTAYLPILKLYIFLFLLLHLRILP